MHKRRTRFAPALSVVSEVLESRTLLSGTSAEVAGARAAHSATKTTLAVSAGTLGQPITFTVTVRGSAAAGSPQGTVDLIDQGAVIQTLELSPTTSTNARSAYSEATYTLTPAPGGAAVYFGKHNVTAEFVPSSNEFGKSTARKSFTVSQPAYTTLADGTQIATIATGSGPQLQSGQTASVLYTGYLEKNGEIFDDSVNDGGSPFSFTVGAGQVITGFDAGVLGMQVGETRIVEIPPTDGYGDVSNGPIPANSTLIFVMTLESIS
jgi:hypothetical protein